MALKPKEIEDALMRKMSQKPKQSDEKAYKKWQEEAEAGYEKLANIGAKVVKEYFKSNPIGVCGSAPWGKLPPDKNLLREPWEAFEKAVLTTDTLKDAGSIKQVKDAIYMGSQEIWLDEEFKKEKEWKKWPSDLTYQMRFRLTLLKNGDQKKNFLLGFFRDKSQKKSLNAFIQVLNLNHWSHKKCKPLLRKIKSLEAQIEELKKRPAIDKGEKSVALPDKPSLATIIKTAKYGSISDLLENEKYVSYISNSQHFKKLSPEDREGLLSEILAWKGLLEDMSKNMPKLEMFYHIVKASEHL